VLADVAREFSPRIEMYGVDASRCAEVALDLSGLTRLFGDARAIASELRRTAADRGVRVRVAVAGTRTAARLLVRHRAGVTIVEPGTEASAIAPLPLALAAAVMKTAAVSAAAAAMAATDDDADALLPTLRRWGLRTLGDLAALPPDEVAARLGARGLEWQRLARGDDAQPLVPSVPEERFEQSLDLEWPIDSLEPLSFVLGRLMEPLSAHLERRDRGAAVLHVRLSLVRMNGSERQMHERSLQLPIPMRDARTLRTLVLLDLESHPPSGPVDRVTVAVDPTPGRIVQYSLLARPLPTPEQISTLTARLQALMGETRCGSPALVDSWAPGAFAMQPFMPTESNARMQKPRSHGNAETDEQRSHAPLQPAATGAMTDVNPLRASAPPRFVEEGAAGVPIVALRRFRHPIPVRVHVRDDAPASVGIMRRGVNGGAIESCAGPWRTSGGWWTDSAQAWDRDEWDVTVTGGGTYRLFRDRHADTWFLEGIVD
jgi:protein ImuB